ncbi:hypothetical protein OG552_35220 [Streptomyces sp. NBC_01476]|uniref:hypothetical protein n=1 Tax=Streptomyces sp. NBC_01476 TaxID=2903881 RepID=UPI002E2F5423|nr:hypothetical protein [Streptomyces sp. NBC_01476]
MPQYATRVTCGLAGGGVIYEWYEGPAPAGDPMTHAVEMRALLTRLKEEGTPPPGWPKSAGQWLECRLVRVQIYWPDETGGLPLAERDF